MQKVMLFCDPHNHFRQEEVPVAKPHDPIDLGEGPKVIEMCVGCEDSLSLKELREVLSVCGRSVARDHTPAEPKEKRTYTRRKPVEAEYKCKFCDDIKKSPQSIGKHEYEAHPYSRLKWDSDQGFDQPGSWNFTPSKQKTRQRFMEQLERIGLTLEEAANREKQLGAYRGSSWHPNPADLANRLAVLHPPQHQQQ